MSATFRIVIATYKRPEDLDRCLGALMPNLEGSEDVKVTVVNDASHDENYEAVIARYEGKLDYHILSENLGPGAARHMGIHTATEDYIICTDDDCVPPKYWLPWIRAHVAAYPEIDLFAGTTTSALEADGSAWQNLLNLSTTYPTAHFTNEGLLTAVTACSVMKRDAYQAAGGFPQDIRGATEDCYLTQEILRAGGTYSVPAEIETRHKANQSLRELRKRFRWYGKGGVQTSFVQNNWKLAATGSDGTLKDAWKTAQTRALGLNSVLKSKSSKDLSWVNRLTAYVVHWIISLDYELGWYTSMRRYQKSGFKSLPAKPRNFAKFN